MPKPKQQTPSSVPSVLYCESSIDLQAASGDDGDKLATFVINAYNGGKMRPAGWGYDVVVDLSGVEVPREDSPILRDHDPGRIVGHSNRVKVQAKKIVVGGVVSGAGPDAQEVVTAAGNDFPWQASVGMNVDKMVFIDEGEKASVNGRSFKGPFVHVVESIYRETSFVAIGADGSTTATITAQSQMKEIVTMTKFEKRIEAMGFDPKTISDDQRESLQAMCDAEDKIEAMKSKPKPKKVEAQADATDDERVAAMNAKLDAAAAERAKRHADIADICGSDHPKIQAKAHDENLTIDQVKLEVQACELADLRANRSNGPGIHINGGTLDASAEVLEVVALRAGNKLTASHIENRYDDKTLSAADATGYRGMRLQEYINIACGGGLPRFASNNEAWLRAAFSTLSLPGILSNVANKSLLEGYNYSEAEWQKIAKVASVNDFKQHTRYRLTDDFTYQPLTPAGEIQHGETDEQQFTQQIDTKAIMYSIDRQTIINDDLSALSAIPFRIGMGAGDAINDLVWTLLLSNPTGTDTFDFFSTDHNNLQTGADSALAILGLTNATTEFKTQTKPNGRPLGGDARYLLVSPELDITASQLMTDVMVNETTTANKPKPANNPHRGRYEVVTSQYLSNASYTGYSATAWYLFADPNRLPALEVAFLNGQQSPTVESAQADFNKLGIQMRGYIDVGAKEQDFRGAQKNAGV